MRAAKRVQLSSEMGHMALKHLEPRINESTIYPILIGETDGFTMCRMPPCMASYWSVYWYPSFIIMIS